MDIYVGIDVSKAGLDVAARSGGEVWRLLNDEGVSQSSRW